VKEFGRKLKEARQEAGFTQSELASRAGIDHSYVSKIERGSYLPNRATALAIIDALEITDSGERAQFLLAAGYAGFEDLERLQDDNPGEEDTHILFGENNFHFPTLRGPIDPLQEKEELLIASMHALLRTSTLSYEERIELLENISSFLEWQKFRIQREHHEPKDK
jgi:transcriptional regulator with XRE-family HTH domain